MYPLKFHNLYYEKIWGGRQLEKYRDNLPEGNIGESWDITCHDNGKSTISNGIHKGKTLEELLKSHKNEILGEVCKEGSFPLLLKIINSKDRLSVQVHPDDKYATKVEKQCGKTEAWYVVEAMPGANIILGTKPCTKQEFKKALDNNEVEKYLNKVEVKKGDVYFIPSGLVHAIGEGITIVEVQESSDLTYRVYDYHRGRALHIEKSLDVINFSLKMEKTNPKVEQNGDNLILKHCHCQYFTLEELRISHSLKQFTHREKFYIYTCVEGSGEIIYEGGTEKIQCLESVLIPASLDTFEFRGKMKLLKIYVSREYCN